MNSYIESFNTFLINVFGKDTASDLLLRTYIIDRHLHTFKYETIATQEYYFLLYVTMKHFMAYINTTYIQHILELASYFVYSYFGPCTSYSFNLFITKLPNDKSDWKSITTRMMTTTNLPEIYLKLSSNRDYYDSQLKEFLLQ